MKLSIRNECEIDYRQVEEVTREAFWNLHVPGCDEHYLVHLMRSHHDFVPALAFVAIIDDKIIGNIMYTKSLLISNGGLRIDTLTFGPISILPDFQRKGIGSALIRHSIENIHTSKYKAVVIEGYPHHYCKYGFVGSKSVNVSNADGKYPYSLLVLELENGSLRNNTWKFHPSSLYNIEQNELIDFDNTFNPKDTTVPYILKPKVQLNI